MSSKELIHAILLAGYFLGLAILAPFWLKHPWLIVGFAFINTVSLIGYGLDKWLAVKGIRRVRERDLLCCDLLGGWLGGYLGQQLWRHKTTKRPYQTRFWLIYGFHILAIIVGYVYFFEV